MQCAGEALEFAPNYAYCCAGCNWPLVLEDVILGWGQGLNARLGAQKVVGKVALQNLIVGFWIQLFPFGLDKDVAGEKGPLLRVLGVDDTGNIGNGSKPVSYLADYLLFFARLDLQGIYGHRSNLLFLVSCRAQIMRPWPGCTCAVLSCATEVACSGFSSCRPVWPIISC